MIWNIKSRYILNKKPEAIASGFLFLGNQHI